jgi:hypothetical protein
VALLLATHFATSLVPLTVISVPTIAEIGRLIVQFRRAGPTPLGCHQFETRLQALLREMGRIIVEWTFNHIEPHDPRDMPGQMESQGTWYRRRSKTPNRSVATLFGTITLWRMLYQDIHGVETSIFPLEVRLGIEAGRATPALAERAAHAAATSTQSTVIYYEDITIPQTKFIHAFSFASPRLTAAYLCGSRSGSPRSRSTPCPCHA